MTMPIEILGVPYQIVVSKQALIKELEEEGIEDTESYAGWCNHFKRTIWVSEEGSSFDLLVRILHELVHAIGYIKGDSKLRSWTKEGEANTDSLAFAFASVLLNVNLVEYLINLVKTIKTKGE